MFIIFLQAKKEINKFICANDLKDKANGRQINADASLSVLLKLEPGDVLTYFNLQRYMKHHFVKVVPPVVVDVVVA
jgi:chromatin remodeling complex protein RSC6